MDILSHGLWGGIAFGRTQKKFFWIAFAFGVFPDLFAFSYVFLKNILSGQIPAGPMPDIPQYVHLLYSISHSLVISGLVVAFAFFFWKSKALPMLAWPLHVIFDIFTHDVDFFPTPFLWPFKTPFFSGIPWNTPWVFFLNWGLIITLYIAWYIIKRWKRSKESKLSRLKNISSVIKDEIKK